MKKWLQRVLVVLIVLLAAIQLYRPARTNPPVDPARRIEAFVDVPAEVSTTLRNACFDCHSNETVWPWYSNVAPVSWWVIGHVDHARGHLNFSDWAAYEPDAAAHKLEEICEEVKEGNMPLERYPIMHPEARLDGGDIESLCAWTRAQSDPRHP